jgi:adenosyl cobinamide kinase/adenosyl cobinamide phosphate guanylyltransferase
VALTFLLGGARSGKSSLAVELGQRHGGPVTYVATAPTGRDDDLDGRIWRHRDERPAAWTTIETEVDLLPALEHADGALVIVDCLTLWVSNLLLAGEPADGIEAAAATAASVSRERSAPTLVVSNEVGLGVHPPTELGRDYRDLLGRVNQTWAAAADTTLFLAAGRAVRLDDPWTLLPPG